jgi:hypothetical protein
MNPPPPHAAYAACGGSAVRGNEPAGRCPWLKVHENRGFPKTSVFGKSTLNLREKAGFKSLFPKPFLKLTEFWERLNIMKNCTSHT